MLDENQIGEIVKKYVGPLIGSSGDPEPDKSVGILVGVTYNGIRYYYHYGQVALHNGGSVLTKDIVFFIGSNTKVFTGTLLALVASATNNAVTPATPVANLVPSNVSINQLPDGEILLWHLATHSAGYPDGVCGPQPAFGDYPFTSMGQFLNDFTPLYDPGEYWVYSNQGFALLGVLLSHAYAGTATPPDWDTSYQNWPGLVVPSIAEPLGMPGTQVDYSNVSARVAQGYAYSDAGGTPAYTPVDPPDWVLTSAGLPAGAISSTLDDMLTFLEASISPPQGALGEAMTLTQQVYPGSEKLFMGFGWQLSNDYLDKNGGIGGYKSYMAFDPGNQIGVFLFGNTSGGNAGHPGNALNQAGRLLLGALRGSPANTTQFPVPPDRKLIPHCPT